MWKFMTAVRVAMFAALTVPKPIGPRIQPGEPLVPTFGAPLVKHEGSPLPGRSLADGH